MSGNQMKVLILDDEADIRSALNEFLKEARCDVHEADNPANAIKILNSHKIDVVFSDIHMPGKSGLQFLAECKQLFTELPSWVFITADASPEVMLKAGKLGAIDTIQKPFDMNQIMTLLNRLKERSADSINDIMDIVQKIAGIRLGKDKRLLVETRLMRRARMLGLSSVDEYKEYFKKNRDKEIDDLISTMTTHTTSFFRESDHFDFMYDQVLPDLFAAKKPIRIWSAASSTGEEVYSLAISVLEYIREKNIPPNQVPSIEVWGTDIDFKSVDMAQKGIYEFERVERLQSSLIKRYFQVGTGELAGLVKIKDEVHKLCKFQQMNLLAKSYLEQKFDIIFIRNVLIYFDSSQVRDIGSKLLKNMNPDGFLFLGHSESFNGLNLPYRLAGNAVYQSSEAKVNKPAAVVAKNAAPMRVLIVDDSVTVRKMLAKILTREHGFEVVGEAKSPIEADQILAKTKVDLITLDIHMPEMDGITYLQKLQGKPHPPIVMVSSISYNDAVSSLQCFELGAVDYIEKPTNLDLTQEAEKIRLVLKAAGSSRRQSRLTYSGSKVNQIDYLRDEKDLILIGASTGGVEAIKEVLTQFPENSPPVLIVQHIPPVFSKAFATRLNDLCQIAVHEAQNGMQVEPGNAYIAAGGHHMKVVEQNGKLKIVTTLDEPVNRHRPSVDYMFDSVVPLASKYRVTAALLTGMGNDGAKGLQSLSKAGAHTIAQNEETSVVFGMPREAIALNAASEVLPLSSIAYHLFKAFKVRRAA